MAGDPGDLLEMVGPSPESSVVQSAVHQVTSYGSSDGIQFLSGQLDMLDALIEGDREGLFEGWEVT